MGDKAGSWAGRGQGAAVGRAGGGETADKAQRPLHLTARLVAHRWASSCPQGGIVSICSRCLSVPPKTRTVAQIGHKQCGTSERSHGISRVVFVGAGAELDSGSQIDGGRHPP